MLLPTDEYYRPTRAGELREQAAQFRRWVTDLRDFRQVGVLTFGCACLLPILFLFSAPNVAAFLVFADVVGVGILAIISGLYEACLVTPLERRALACEQEAEALEREHQTRYGETQYQKMLPKVDASREHSAANSLR
jgi:hypothetical protein